MKALRSKPVELECGTDEVLCLVDSGSTINAASIGKHFPKYADLVESTPASERGDFATIAGGDKLFNKGRCMIKGQAQDQPSPVTLKDMEVELPFLSVRKIVKKKNDVRFTQKGGTIRSQVTGKTIKFFEHEGVYFLNIKISGPNDNTGQLGFVRPRTP